MPWDPVTCLDRIQDRRLCSRKKVTLESVSAGFLHGSVTLTTVSCRHQQLLDESCRSQVTSGDFSSPQIQK
ncbi:uncharacterized protein V6R79_021740 [Siganus canaliculatus]